MFNDIIKIYEFLNDIVKEVFIYYEYYFKFLKLGLKWYVVFIILNMDLKIGGIIYFIVFFNGWYMVIEIVVCNFIDIYCYNFLEKVVEVFEFDIFKNNLFNKDWVFVELNYVVYYLFKVDGVFIVDYLIVVK